MTNSSSVIKPFALLVAALGLCACSTSAPRSSIGQEQDRASERAELLTLNDKLAQSQIVDRDPAFIRSVALDQFRVLAPGGLIENKEQAISGISAWNATSVKLTGTEVIFHGPVAVVMGRMDIDGEMKPVGRWGPLKYMSTWVREGNEWKILSRSLTPCLDKLVELGRC